MTKKLIQQAHITGSEGDVKITLSGATFQENEDLSLQFVDPEFGVWLMEQIFWQEKILAIKKGWLRKKYFCSGCGAELNPTLCSPVEVSYRLEFSDYPPFSVSILLPCVTCSQCNKPCGIDLRDRLDFQISEAFVYAFERANIRA
ncbi:MAG: hypothetical protein HY869_01290 [Chloroflexi bacterium]|nr:hypothetical protein [Chloroflexota bacterium]